MEFVAKLKTVERAWKHGHITTTEYHQTINYFLRRIYEQEASL